MDNPVPRSPLCFVLMPFGRKTDAAGRTTDFDAVYREIIAPAVVDGWARPDPGRRGAGRRHDPQADVRTADALRLCRRRHHRRQSQRVLRTRHPARDAAAQHRDPVRGRHDAAVRHRAAARRSLPHQRHRHAARPESMRGQRGAATAGSAPEPARRQSAVPAARLHAAVRRRSQQDRHLPRPVRLFEKVQGAPGRGPQEGAGPRQGDRGRSGARPICPTSRPGSWSISTCRCATSRRTPR